MDEAVAKATVEISPDLTNFGEELKAKLDAAMADKDTTAKIGLDESGVDRTLSDAEEKLRVFGTQSATAEVKVKTDTAAANIEDLNRKMDTALGEMEHLHESGDSGAEGINNLGGAASGAGETMGGILLPAILTLAPAISPLIGVATGATLALAGMGTAAVAGVGAFGLAALPIYKQVSTAITRISADQTAVNRATTATAKATAYQHLLHDIRSLNPEVANLVMNVEQVKTSFMNWDKQFEPDVLKVFSAALTIVNPLLQDMTPLVHSGADALTMLFVNIKQALEQSDFKQFIDWLGVEGPRALLTFVSFFESFAGGLSKMFEALTPYMHELENGIMDLGHHFESFSESNAFKHFVEYLLEAAPKVGQFLQSAFGALESILVTLAPAGMIVVEALTEMLHAFTEINNALPTGTLGFAMVFAGLGITAALGAKSLKAVKGALDDIRDAWGLAKGAMNDLSGALDTIRLRAMYAHDWMSNLWTSLKGSSLGSAVSSLKSFGLALLGVGTDTEVLRARMIALSTVGILVVITAVVLLIQHFGVLHGLMIAGAAAVLGLVVAFAILDAVPLVAIIVGIALAVAGLIAGIIDLAKHWDTVWHGIVTVAEDVWHFIDGVFTNGIIGDILSIASPLIGLVTHWQQAWGLIKAILADAWGFIQDVFIKIPSQIEHVFADAGKWLYQAGKDVLEGLKNGIEAVALAPVHAAQKVGHDIVAGAKAVLGVFSPSTVMVEIGSNLMQGLANGIKDNAQLATNEMKAVSAALKLSTDLDKIGASAQKMAGYLNQVSQALLVMTQIAQTTAKTGLQPVIDTVKKIADTLKADGGAKLTSSFTDALKDIATIAQNLHGDDIIRSLQGIQYALVAFSGEAKLIKPMADQMKTGFDSLKSTFQGAEGPAKKFADVIGGMQSKFDKFTQDMTKAADKAGGLKHALQGIEQELTTMGANIVKAGQLISVQLYLAMVADEREAKLLAPAFKQAADAIDTGAKKIGDAAKQWQTLADALKKASDHLTSIMNETAKMKGSLDDAATSVLKIVLGFQLMNQGFTQITTQLNTFTQLWRSQWDINRQVMQTFVDQMTTMFIQLRTQGFDQTVTNLQTFRSQWQTAFSQIEQDTHTAIAQLVSDMKVIVDQGLTPLKTGIDRFKSTWHTDWDDVKSSVSGVWSAISSQFSSIETGLTQMQTGASNLGSTWAVTWSGMSTAVQNMANTVSPILSSLKTALQQVQTQAAVAIPAAAAAQAAAANTIPGHANGGVIPANTWSWVGEQGKELVWSGSNAAAVFSHPQSNALVAGSSAGLLGSAVNTGTAPQGGQTSVSMQPTIVIQGSTLSESQLSGAIGQALSQFSNELGQLIDAHGSNP